jgi:hypothetical protein
MQVLTASLTPGVLQLIPPTAPQADQGSAILVI